MVSVARVESLLSAETQSVLYGHQVTNFSFQQLGHYELLPDGKNLFLTREQRHSDAVIVRDAAATQR